MPPKQIVVIMQQDYPFGQCDECNTENTRVLVRKIYALNPQQKKKIIQKTAVLRKLKNQYLIKLESVLEEQESIHFLYEYIPIKLQTWISNINNQFIQNFRDQLIKLSVFLVNNSIKIQFKLKNIGMDQDYGAKYFLDLNFQIDPTVNKDKLKSNYIRQINNLFQPYLVSSASRPSQRFIKDTSIKQIEANDKSTNQPVDKAISPPTNKPKSKQKALQKYYQQVNMSVDSQNQKILQQFMDVLDNQAEEQSNKTPSYLNKNTNKSKQQSKLPILNLNKKQNSYKQPVQVSHNPTVQSKNSQTKAQFHYFRQSKPSTQKQIAQINKPQKKLIQDINKKLSIQKQLLVQSSNIIPQQVKSQYQKKGVGRKSQHKQGKDKWRQSFDLQARARYAIERSYEVIRRFKAIKEIIQH